MSEPRRSGSRSRRPALQRTASATKHLPTFARLHADVAVDFPSAYYRTQIRMEEGIMFRRIEHEEASLELENGVPVELRWDHRRWRVLDRPTRLGIRGDVYSPLVTHPPRVWSGWRFTARSDGDGVYVFDVEVVNSSRCEVLYVYE